jgi:5-bromo-4-chloroindolyl phosphate hydrolysis protein
MSTTAAFIFGTVFGLLVAATMILATLVRYVSSDLEAFSRWLDKA